MTGLPNTVSAVPVTIAGPTLRTEVQHSVHQLVDYVVRQSSTDATMRALLLNVAHYIQTTLGASPAETAMEGSVPQHDSSAYRPHPVAPSKPIPASTAPFLKQVSGTPMDMVRPAFREVSMPGTGGPAPMAGWQAQAPGDEDLPTIESRCRLKAEASRWAGTRQRLLKDGVDFHTEIEPKDRDVIGRAKALPECFLWMNHKESPVPRDLSIYDDMAGAYETTAQALALLRTMLKVAHDDREAFGEVLQLTAEAQSCVRGAVIEMDGKPDRDQMKIFYWLRTAGADYQILIRRFMRQDDIADFRSWPDVKKRLDELEGRLAHLKNRDKTQKLLLNKIRHLAKKVQDKPVGDDWADLVGAVDELVQCGVQPSSKDIRDLLLPVVESIPDMPEYPRNFGLVLREIDKFRTAEGAAEPEEEQEDDVSEDVKKVAELLAGKALILIGGDRRAAAADALIRAFRLSDLIWIETREHQTHTVFEPHVSRDDVAAVILAIRWSSHGFGEVKDFCDRYDKPLVRLPAGYSPNQVAHHILGQIAERLAH